MPNAAPTHKPKRTQPTARSTKVGDPFYSSHKWRQLRSAVLYRDHYLCKACGTVCVNKQQAHVDHIVERKTDPSRAYDMDNLQTLCASCHSKKTRRTHAA